MKADVYYGIGNKGRLFSIMDYTNLEEHDKEVTATNKGHTILTTQMITDISRRATVIEMKKKHDLEDLFLAVSDYYSHSGIFGPYGDLIELTKVETEKKDFYVAKIGRIDLRTHTAADLGIFIKGKDEEGKDIVYAVTGVREHEPGKGLLAIIGGLRNCNEKVLDSPFYTVLHEAEEEAGVNIICPDAESFRENYNVNKKEVKVTVGNREIDSIVHLIGTYPTSCKEAFKGTGRKRVYATTAFILPIDLKDATINPNILGNYFKPTAEEDIERLSFVDITKAIRDNDFTAIPKLAFSHHDRIMEELIIKAREIYGGLK